MTSKGGASLVLLSMVLAACQNAESPTEPIRQPQFEVLDGAHNSGNEHFFLLPPMVPLPSYGGTFDGTVSPVVQICEWTGTACVAPLLAEFSMTTGPGSETVRVNTTEEYYIVNWHTDQFGLDVTKTYRVIVRVDAQELGHADVDVVSGGNELRHVQTGQYIPLLDGRTLPVKFRIEQGALAYGVFRLPGRIVKGIAYDAGILWALTAEPMGILKLDATTGEVLLELGLDGNIRGITVGAGSLWMTEATYDRVLRVDPSNLSTISRFPTSTWESPSTEPNGIAFDGTSLWFTDPYWQRVFKVSTAGARLNEFYIPNAYRQGLEWDGAGLWTNTGALELSHYLTDGTIDQVRTLTGLPAGTHVFDLAIGNGKVYLSFNDGIYVQAWP